MTVAALRALLDQEQPHVPRYPAPRLPRRHFTAKETPAMQPPAPEPAAPPASTYAVMCGGCTDVHLLDHRKRTSEWFCATCTKQRTARFRPAVGGQVALLDDPFPADYVILTIDGDDVTLRRQGIPADHALGAPFTRRLGHLDPLRSPNAHPGSSPQPQPPAPAPQEEPVNAETPAALLLRAAAKLRANQTTAHDEPLADWLEDCAQDAEKLLLPLRHHRALTVALAALGETPDPLPTGGPR